MLESLFNNVSVLQIYEKETPAQVFYREFAKFLRKAFFIEHLPYLVSNPQIWDFEIYF